MAGIDVGRRHGSVRRGRHQRADAQRLRMGWPAAVRGCVRLRAPRPGHRLRRAPRHGHRTGDRHRRVAGVAVRAVRGGQSRRFRRPPPVLRQAPQRVPEQPGVPRFRRAPCGSAGRTLRPAPVHRRVACIERIREPLLLPELRRGVPRLAEEPLWNGRGPQRGVDQCVLEPYLRFVRSDRTAEPAGGRLRREPVRAARGVPRLRAVLRRIPAFGIRHGKERHPAPRPVHAGHDEFLRPRRAIRLREVGRRSRRRVLGLLRRPAGFARRHQLLACDDARSQAWPAVHAHGAVTRQAVLVQPGATVRADAPPELPGAGAWRRHRAVLPAQAQPRRMRAVPRSGRRVGRKRPTADVPRGPRAGRGTAAHRPGDPGNADPLPCRRHVRLGSRGGP